MRTIEDIYADRIVAKDLGILDEPEVISALNMDAGDEFSINEEGVWGNNVDITEFEDTKLTIRTERTMGFMGYNGNPQ